MVTNTSKYIQGMGDVFNFFEMLYSAIQTAMPGAIFSTTGCMGWRGYRIDAFKNLAYRQYYCQIYTDNPNQLVFEEAYHEPGHPSDNSKDFKYRLIRGDYYYPFVLNMELYKIHFFRLTATEQFQTLVNYVSFANMQAQLWQESSVRAHVTTPKRLHGTKSQRHLRGDLQSFEQVSEEFLDVFCIQYDLLKKLEAVLFGVGPSVIGKEVEFLRVNKSWQNWDFRGLRLKLKGLNPNSHADYLWEIYYSQPTKLTCFSYDGSNRKPLGYFDIEDSKYFDQTDENQTELLTTFVRNVLVK